LKQCPACNRTYSDDTLNYCLEDGSSLRQAYDPQATQRFSPPRVTDLPTMAAPPAQYYAPAQPQPVGRNRGPIYLVIAVLVVVLGIGAVALMLTVASRSERSSSSLNANDARPTVTQSSPSPPQTNANEQAMITKPSPSPAVSRRQLMGAWRGDVYEHNLSVEITYTFVANGTSRMVFKRSDGTTGTDSGTWRYSNGILYEGFSNGASGKGSIRWIDENHFEITIIENGVPADAWRKRQYRRIS